MPWSVRRIAKAVSRMQHVRPRLNSIVARLSGVYAGHVGSPS
jgi:hypothetical protein